MVQLLAALCVLLATTLIVVVLFDEGPHDHQPSESSVRACDRLQAMLRSGTITPAEYRRQLGTLAADEERRAPLTVPPER